MATKYVNGFTPGELIPLMGETIGRIVHDFFCFLAGTFSETLPARVEQYAGAGMYVRPDRPLDNRCGFISVIALGIVINAAIFTYGLVTETPAELRQEDAIMQYDARNVRYEQGMQGMLHDRITGMPYNFAPDSNQWLREKMDAGVPIRFSGRERFVRFPRRDMYGNIIGTPPSGTIPYR